MPNVHPKSGGPYTLYCDECGCWIPNTANTEMRKEGAIAYSHFCDNGVCDMRNGEILDSSRKKAQEDSAVRKHIGKPVPACCIRANIKPGMEVDIVLKKDQPTGILTRGVVKAILTNSHTHPRGIKVMLTDRSVGRVQEFPAKA